VANTAALVGGWIEQLAWQHHRLARGSVADVWQSWECGSAVTVYPADLLPLRVELLLGGSWIDISQWVLYRDQVRLTRGRTSEGQTANPSTAAMTLDNRDGRFSPRNPLGPYYGKLSRNVQLRAFVLDPGTPWARRYRFWGEVPEWPTAVDQSVRDIYIPIQAAGVLRRLALRSKALRSAYYRGTASGLTPTASLRAYWPLEDSVGSVTLASGMSGGYPAQVVGVPVFEADATSFVCSDALPTMGTGQFVCRVVDYASNNKIQARWLQATPSAGTTNNAILCRVFGTGTVARWDVFYQTGGSIGVNAYDGSNTLISTLGPTAFAIDGKVLRISLQLSANGADIKATLATLAPGSSGGLFIDYAVVAQTVGKATRIDFAPQKDMSGVTIGHVTLQSTISSIFADDDQLRAYAYETGQARIARLCAEENVSCTVVDGATSQGISMGAQLQKSLTDLLREAEVVDGGLLFESRDSFGLTYVTRTALYDQSAALALNFAAADLSTFQPVEDDQNIVNDVTATRPGGSSARYTVTSGALSINDPPAGVGLYDTSVEVNVWADSELTNQAAWRAGIGTTDEPRYPSLAIDLGRQNFYSSALIGVPGFNATAASAALNVNGANLEIGKRVTVSNPPAFMPPETISTIVIGMSEVIDQRTWQIAFVAVPEAPYHVGVWSDLSLFRWSPDSTVIVGIHDATTTTLNINTPSNIGVWTIADGSFDIMVAGERMTVTNVTGAGPTQVMTVTRSVNGISKVHADGEAVNLFTPALWGL